MDLSAPMIVYAPFAAKPEESRGRLYPENESANRSPFQRDRDRIIHSTAFRRMKHKTQVFVFHEGDHYRTRLTHSLEVAQIARSICRALGLNEDLGEALALAHDLGHPPFGHAGEDALDAAMAPFGGFDHNAQTLKILTRLEARYADFDGLNLTWETLEGVVKHNGPLVPDAGGGAEARPIAKAIAGYVALHDLELDTFPSAEAQVAALSDDIAYNNHDLDDGLRARLFEVEDLRDVPLVGEMFETVARSHPGLEHQRLVHECVRRLIDHMVTDLLAESRSRLQSTGVQSADDVRRLGRPVASFSENMVVNDRALKNFLFQRMYRHYKVEEMAEQARTVVSELFAQFLAEPMRLPDLWRDRARGADTPQTARIVGDYIAGMTDRFALDEHKRIFNETDS